MELNIGKNYEVKTDNDTFSGSLKRIIKRDDGKIMMLFLEKVYRAYVDENIISIEKQKRGKL